MARLKTRSYGTLLAALLMSSIGVPGLRPALQAQTKATDDTLKDRIDTASRRLRSSRSTTSA